MPSWHRLYFVVSFTIGLLALAEAAPRASAWRHLIEFLAVVAIFGGMALWVRANRAALAEDDGCSCAEREIEIRMVHAPRSATRPSGEPEQAEVGYEIVLAAGHDGPVRGFSRSNLPSASPRA